MEYQAASAQDNQTTHKSSKPNTANPIQTPKFADRRFRDNARFTKIFRKWNNQTKKWDQTVQSGVVLHLREMYGGPPYTYMVKYDDPLLKDEHNAIEDEIKPC